MGFHLYALDFTMCTLKEDSCWAGDFDGYASIAYIRSHGWSFVPYSLSSALPPSDASSALSPFSGSGVVGVGEGDGEGCQGGGSGCGKGGAVSAAPDTEDRWGLYRR